MKLYELTVLGVAAQLFCMPAFACTLSASSLQFGSINPIADISYNSNASISITCPTLSNFSVSLSPGAGTYTQRTMMSGVDTLKYNMFLDAARTQVWGDGTSSTVTWNSTTDSSGVTQTVYGHVPHQPQAYPGSYADSITVTVTF